MQIEKYLSTYQPIVERTFINALENKKLSHAYLLSGSVGMPLKEAAIYLAKTLLCDDPTPMACNKCITCARIDEGNYADLIVVGGEGSKIKKEDVSKIISNFDKTALENKGVMIYVLHLVEKMTAFAVNSLLKFLEEPGKNIYAFLTTENETKVLPTIISRTQVLRFREINRQKVLNDSIEIGVNQSDAEILSGFYNDAEIIKKVAESNEYKKAKECLDIQLEALGEDSSKAIYVNQKIVIPEMKSQDTARIYFKMLGVVFQDLLNLSVNETITIKSYDNILREVLPHVKNVEKSLTTIMSSSNKLDMNVNSALILDHIMYQITKEEKRWKLLIMLV